MTSSGITEHSELFTRAIPPLVLCVAVRVTLAVNDLIQVRPVTVILEVLAPPIVREPVVCMLSRVR